MALAQALRLPHISSPHTQLVSIHLPAHSGGSSFRESKGHLEDHHHVSFWWLFFPFLKKNPGQNNLSHPAEALTQLPSAQQKLRRSEANCRRRPRQRQGVASEGHAGPRELGRWKPPTQVEPNGPFSCRDRAPGRLHGQEAIFSR